MYFEPGTGHHYSNVNYQLLRWRSRRRRVRTWRRSCRSGWPDHSHCLRLGQRRPISACRTCGVYTKDPATGVLVDTTTDLLAVGNGGSGGIVSTAGDLLDLLEAIVSGDLLPARLREEMTAPTAYPNGTYGLGVVTFVLKCGDYLGHGGAIAGTHALALVSPDGAAGVVIAVNLRGDPEPNLLAAAEELICDTRW